MKSFEEMYETTQAKSLLDRVRMESVYNLLKSVEHLPGAIAEFGVYKGGLSYMMSWVRMAGALHLFDTFEGMPDMGQAKGEHKKGDFHDTSFIAVDDFLKEKACPSVTRIFHKGVFPDTTQNWGHLRFAFVHLDADLYQSTLDGLAYFWPRMTKGGIIVLDDLDLDSCPGVAKALDEMGFTTVEHPAPYQGALRMEM